MAPRNNAWIGLALAVAAAAASLFWYGRPPETPRISEHGAATSANAAPSSSARAWDELEYLERTDPDAAMVRKNALRRSGARAAPSASGP